jgi:two-component sensor histidine kinase
VNIHWSIEAGRLKLEWSESGGPIVVEPTHRGFGTRLVNGVLASFNGEVDARFEATGLRCTMTLDAPSATVSPPVQPEMAVANRTAAR